MNAESQEQKEGSVMDAETLLQFKNAMEAQARQNGRVSRTSSYMISFGVIAIILLSIGVVFLTWSQKNDMSKMNDYMEGMTKNISVMSNAVVKMEVSMSKVEGGVYELSQHAQSISRLINQKENLTGTLSNIAETINLLQMDAHGFDKSMGEVNYNLNNINKQMKNLNRKLSIMIQSTNSMPNPTRMFPF